jgi:hypothetical protein
MLAASTRVAGASPSQLALGADDETVTSPVGVPAATSSRPRAPMSRAEIDRE